MANPQLPLLQKQDMPPLGGCNRWSKTVSGTLSFKTILKGQFQKAIHKPKGANWSPVAGRRWTSLKSDSNT